MEPTTLAPKAVPPPPKPEPSAAKTSATVEGTPELMAELMRAFIANPDLNARVKIRLRMKALLDFVAVDTKYPKNPALDGTRRPRPGFLAAQPGYVDNEVGDLRGAVARQVGENAGLGEIHPVPGAQPMDNNDILG